MQIYVCMHVGLGSVSGIEKKASKQRIQWKQINICDTFVCVCVLYIVAITAAAATKTATASCVRGVSVCMYMCVHE